MNLFGLSFILHDLLCTEIIIRFWLLISRKHWINRRQYCWGGKTANKFFAFSFPWPLLSFKEHFSLLCLVWDHLCLLTGAEEQEEERAVNFYGSQTYTCDASKVVRKLFRTGFIAFVSDLICGSRKGNNFDWRFLSKNRSSNV